MESFNELVTVRDYNNRIAKLGDRKQLSEAIVVFAKCRGLNMANSHTMGTMLNAYIRCGCVEDAHKLFNELLSKKTLKFLRPDVIAYTTMIKGFCSIFDIPAAIKLFDTMVERSVTPNIRTLNTLFRGLAVVGGLNEMLRVFKKGTELSITFDSSSYEIIICSLCQAYQLDIVYPLLGRIKSDPNIKPGLHRMYYYLCRAAAFVGDWKKMNKALVGASAAPSTAELESKAESVADGTAVGGKRAWREVDETRKESLEYFNVHRSEVRAFLTFHSLRSLSLPFTGAPAGDRLSRRLPCQVEECATGGTAS